MKKLRFLCFSLFMAVQAHAQSVIATAGGDGEAGSMHLSYTLGESFASAIQNDSLVATQGFHQPFLTITAVEEALPPGAILVYPNPASSVLNVQLEGLNIEKISLSLYNLNGQLLSTAKPAASLWQTDLSHLPNGSYMLRVTDKASDNTTSFKILKLN